MKNWDKFPMYFVGVSGVVDKEMVWQLDCLHMNPMAPGIPIEAAEEYLPYFFSAKNAREFAKTKHLDRTATVENLKALLQFTLFLQREKVILIGFMKRPDRFNPEWYATNCSEVEDVLADIRTALKSEEK